jgi:hypothetical protein
MSIARKGLTTALSPVDRLGALRAQIAELSAVEKVLVEEIKSWGPGIHEAELFSATVAEILGRETLDVHACEEKLRELGVDGRWFAKHTKIGKASLRLTVTDR